MRHDRFSIGKSIAEEAEKRRMTLTQIESIFRNCKTFDCVYREIMQNDSVFINNCTYRYPLNEQDDVSAYALWIDGPCTVIAALLALIGAKYAIKFLCRAGLNRELTAALFALCAIDCLLLITVFFFYSIEATSILFFRTNIMYNKQAFTYTLHGIASSLTTSSTMLVIFITFLRFMVVMRPLRYATTLNFKNGCRRSGSKAARRTSGSAVVIEESMGPAPILRGNHGNSSIKRQLKIRQMIKPFFTPFFLILLSFSVNIPVFFEFTLQTCFDVEHKVNSTNPEATVFRASFAKYKAILMTLTQTIGPVSVILILSILTEYKVHISLKARRKLFESQQRSRSVVISEELKERVSRTVAIFIAAKFLIFRTMPIFFDIYENLYGIDGWGTFMSVMVRVSDFGIVLNTATNSLAYFGKKRWIEKRLRLRLLKKEEKRNAKATSSNTLSSSSAKKNGLNHPLTAEKTPLMTPPTIKNVYSEMV